MRRAAAIAVALIVVAPPSGAFAASPAPVLGRRVVVERVAGTVLLRPFHGRRFAPVTRPVAAAVGSTVDVTHGKVRLTAAEDAQGKRRATGVFYGGRFSFAQPRTPDAYVAIGLEGGAFRACAVAAAGKQPASHQVRRLWAQAKGRFVTVGRYAAATVRGTVWLTADRCDGTFALSKRGVVDTTSADGRLEQLLRPGQSIVYFCNPDGSYCTVLWFQPDVHAQGFALGDFYSAGLAVKTASTAYDLCVTKPGKAETCTTYQLSAPDTFGYRRSEVTCTAERPGDYSVRWMLDGAQLGPPLVFTATHSPPPGVGGCTAATL